MSMDENLEEELNRELRESMIEQGHYVVTTQMTRLEELRFTFQTMGDLIKREEQIEVARIEEAHKQAGKNPEKINWGVEYPYWWPQIIESHFHSSFIATLVSYIETTLNQVCQLVDEVMAPSIKLTQIHGSFPKRHKIFLEAFGRFTGSRTEVWDILTGIYAVRCAVVHNDLIVKKDDKTKIIRLKEIAPGLIMDNNTVKIESAFCQYCLDFVSEFNGVLMKEVDTFMTLYGSR